ncbi:MAG: Rieske (2Fe-2S) protein, partial [Rhodobacteraceae bacterium]|nr:Rieske (2Fe-2S) protein [Paracoccaceae bacterium]
MARDETVPSPAEELCASVAVPFAQARAMPKSVYTSAEFTALEERRIFAREWLCAGRAEALPNPGDYMTMTIAGEPVIVLRDGAGTLRAMSNVCRHRMSTLLEGRGNARSIVCPYHAWTYGL